jgi:hypothetical protein
MKNPYEIIDQLSPDDALAVLKALARDDETLVARIAESATAHLGKVDPEEVAFGLYEELDSLEVEEIWDRAGQSRHGYVSPGEAAGDMVDEVIAPYLGELAKYQKLGMSTEVNRMCMGLLLGLYRFDDESTSTFKEWAPDTAGIFAETVVDAWKAGSPRRTDVKALRAFIENELFGWGARFV